MPPSYTCRRTQQIMGEGIGYALGARLLYGVADFVYKRGAAAGAEPHHFLMVQTWFFSSFAILYGLFSGELALNRGAFWGALAGLFVVIGYYNFAWSLKSGAVSTHATIFRLSFAVTVALAVLVLGEPLTAPKLAGLALVLAAVWLLLAAPGAAGGDAHRERRSSLARVLVATVAIGIASFTYKLGLRDGATPISLVAAQGAVAVTLSTAFSAYVDRSIRPSRAAWNHAPVAAALLVVAFTFLAKGLEGGEASVVVPGRANGIRRDRASRVLLPQGAVHGAQVRRPRRRPRRSGEPRAGLTRIIPAKRDAASGSRRTALPRSAC